VITVEPMRPGALPYSQTIIVFCGEQHDAPPSTADVYTASGGLVAGGVMDTARAINEAGAYGFDTQHAIWHWNDGFDITGSAGAQVLARCTSITPGNGAEAALAGLLGAALLVGMTLLEAGVSVAEVIAAFRENGVAGLRQLADRVEETGPPGQV
jgi:hypothetical protein